MQLTENPEQEKQIQETLAAHPGMTREQLFQHHARQQVMETAASAPFPGPMREAFATGKKTALGFTLQPVNMILLSILERIHSPFIPTIDVIREMHTRPPEEIAQAINEKLHPTTDQLIETTFCFVTPAKEVLAILENGHAELTRAAMEKIGAALHPVEFADLNREILMHYLGSFITAIKYQSKKAEGDTSFPSAPVEAKTASAGA